MSRQPREDLIDALRACALLGVLVVNAVSYGTFPEGTQLGAPHPKDSTLAIATLTAVAFALQGKAYPLLAFLFGYSVVRSMGRRPLGDETLQARRGRMARLVLLGALHGSLVYAGDILAVYGVLGWMIVGCMRWRTGKLLRHAKRWLLVAVALNLLFTALMWSMLGTHEPEAPSRSLVDAAGWPQYLALNASWFGTMWLGLVLLITPDLLAAMLAGAVAARLRWFTHPRWKGSRERAWRWLLPLGLVLSAAYAAFMAWALQQPPMGWDSVAASSSQLPGWILGAGLALTLVRAWHAGPPSWLASLAPLGRYTLSLYLVNSVLLMVLFSGPGLKLPPTTVVLFGYACVLWWLAWRLARVAHRAGWRGPFEAWLSGSKPAMRA